MRLLKHELKQFVKMQEQDNIIDLVLKLYILTILVNFNVVNIFPNINNMSGLKSVKDVLLDNNYNLDSTQCIIGGLGIFLTCNNSKFNRQVFL